MTNNAEEIGAIMQLLTGDRSIPTRGVFVEEFMGRNEDGVLEVRPDKLEDLQAIFRGRVSYLRAPSITTDFMGETVGSLRHFKVYPDQISEHQLDAYTQAYARDKGESTETNVEAEDETVLEASGIFNASRQAALLVYPDGSWGTAGYEKYVKGNTPLFEGTPSLEDVYRLSAKYGMILEQLLDMKSGKIPRRKMFIFCKFLNGSGLNVFGKILEKFGWKRATRSAGADGDYYAIISSNKGKGGENVNKLISGFNSAENVTGERLQILMGTEKLAEGYDLYDCDICHILTPHWNYAQTEQAIARIKRMGRHARLAEDQGSEVTVKVYQHCLVTPENTPESIDLKMYETAEKKDVAIAKMRRILKEAAMDCQLTYARNFRPGEIPFSRECDYMECEYTCNGITDVGSTNISMQTWQLYYADTVAIKELLTAVLRARLSVTIPEAIDYIKTGTDRISPAKVTVHSLLRVVSEMIDSAEPVTDLFGFTGYISAEADRIFLTTNPYGIPMGTDTEYLREIAVENPVDIQQYIVPSLYVQILTTKNMADDKRKELLEFLSDSAKEKLLEDVVLSRRNIPSMNNPGREAVYRMFEDQLIVESDRIVSTLLYDDATGGGARCLNNDSNQWEDCRLVAGATAVSLTAEEAKAAAKARGLGFYGKIDSNKKFKIVNFENGGSKNGKVCTTYTKTDLQKFAKALDSEGSSGITVVADLCKFIRQKLAENSLIVQ